MTKNTHNIFKKYVLIILYSTKNIKLSYGELIWLQV